MPALNPFEFGRELTADELVDREDELAELVSVLTNARKYFLIGPRRFGKTSLLAAATERAERKKARVLRYNAELFPTLDQLAARIVADAASILSGTTEKIGKAAAGFFKALKPEIAFNPSDGTWSAALGISTPAANTVPVLAEALEGLERAARSRDHPTALILDEFQRIVSPGGVEAEHQIRGVIQQHKSVAYAFAGSETGMLAAMTGEPNRPFYRLGTRRFLGAIPRGPFRASLRQGLALVSAVSEAGIEAILDVAEDVPYNVQLLAHACWDRCREQGKGAKLTPELVRTAQEEMAARSDPLFTHLWTSLTSPQQRALLAVVHEQGQGLTSGAVMKRYDLTASGMQKAVQGLKQRGIAREELQAGTTRLRLEDPLFGTWVRETVPAR